MGLVVSSLVIDGKVVGRIGVLRDLTPRLQAKEALQQANAGLEQCMAERTAALEQQTQRLQQEMTERQRRQAALFQREKLAALGMLLANVAHELNNPLAVAVWQLDNLQEEKHPGTWIEDMALLRQAIERCKGTVQSFLALSRQPEPTRRAVGLSVIIDDMLVLLEPILAVDGVHVECQLPGDLPRLWADPHQLQHVIANLITNAHHALRQTAPPRKLSLAATTTTDRSGVILKVTDSGPGIPQELQRRVFDPFFSTKPQGAGSGLGLALCRSIIEGHGGTIRIDSQPGHGTTVFVLLPAAVPELQESEPTPAFTTLAQTTSPAILLIDDEPGVRQALQRMLQRSGYEVTTVADAQAGLAALAAHSYAVILCDTRMPNLDGPGFYRELERRQPQLLTRVVFLTGDVLSVDIQTFFAQVDTLRLQKPCRPHELRRVIQQVLDAR